MATRVGTGVTGQADPETNTIAAAAKSTTTGNLLVAFVKWERTGSSLTGIADTAGNTWAIVASLTHASATDLKCALAYAMNITGHAANVVTATMSSVNCAYRRIVVEEFAGLATTSAEDGAEQTTNNGAGSPFDTAAITTTQAGLVFLGVAAYGTLTGVAGAGSPTFTVANTVADTTAGFLLSGAAQSVTPSLTASSGGGGADVCIAQAFKDAAAATLAGEDGALWYLVVQE